MIKTTESVAHTTGCNFTIQPARKKLESNISLRSYGRLSVICTKMPQLVSIDKKSTDTDRYRYWSCLFIWFVFPKLWFSRQTETTIASTYFILLFCLFCFRTTKLNESCLRSTSFMNFTTKSVHEPTSNSCSRKRESLSARFNFVGLAPSVHYTE